MGNRAYILDKDVKMVTKRTWICPKCGKTRSNRQTHKHGEDMKEDLNGNI